MEPCPPWPLSRLPATLDQTTADEAKAHWTSLLGGLGREPVILPNGTVVQPLAWSPTDTQLAEARRLTLIDVANIFNLDGYWLGAPVAGMTYRTAGPQYQQALRTSLEPVLADFEDVWSFALLVRGQAIRFQRLQSLHGGLSDLYGRRGVWLPGRHYHARRVPGHGGPTAGLRRLSASVPGRTRPHRRSRAGRSQRAA